MLNEDQLREHDDHLNHVIDVLTTVSTAVRNAYPPDERATSIVQNVSDAISGIQALRSELRHLPLQKEIPTATDMSRLYQQLESRILDLDGVKEPHRRKKGGVAFKAHALMRRQFISVYVYHNHVTLYLRIPLDKINDPREICLTHRLGDDWTPVQFGSVDDLDYVMELVQQAYTHNLREPQQTPSKIYYRLVVTMPDGERVANDSARKTFFDVITRIGVEQVKDCAPTIVFSNRPDNSDKYTYWRHGRYYILVGGKVAAVQSKATALRKIVASLDLDIKVKADPK